MLDKEDVKQIVDAFYARLEEEHRLPPIQDEIRGYRKPAWAKDLTELNRPTIHAIASTVIRMLDKNSRLYEAKILSVAQVAERLNIGQQEARKIAPYIGGFKSGPSQSAPIQFLDDGKLIEKYMDYCNRKAAGAL